jgi:hypothetical protein
MPDKTKSRKRSATAKSAKTNFSFILEHPQIEKMSTLLGFAVANGVKCQKATIMRALIEAGSNDMEFLTIVGRLTELEKDHWLERRGLKGATGKAVPGGKPEKANFSFIPTAFQQERMDSLLAYAVEKGVKCQMGTIMRALIEAGSDDIEFLGIVRRLAEAEKEQWCEKRGFKTTAIQQ